LSKPSLSTMWGIGRFDDLRVFVRKALEMGFEAIELNYDVTPTMLTSIRQTGVPITSLHNCCPQAVDAAGRRIRGLVLSSLDEQTRRLAVDFTRQTIDAAQSLGAKAIILHSGNLDLVAEEGRLQNLFERGKAGSEDYRQARENLMTRRALVRQPYLDAFRKSLNSISRHAAEKGIMVGLENRADYHDIPNLEDMKLLLSGFDAGPVGYWHDVGHAHRLEVLGFYKHQEWLDAFEGRLIGMHLHDCVGLKDHQCPGTGEIDFSLLKRYVRPETLLVAELNRVNPENAVKAGLEYLRRLGFFDNGDPQ
jgi:sugar phosphate isomerase/epimerase